MGTISGKLGRPTLGRIVTVAVLLMLTAQMVLTYIGLSFAKSIDTSLNDQRTEVMLGQFQQNMIYQLNDINNLLLLLETPDFSFFFQNLMSLRDEETVAQKKQLLLDKMSSLDLQPELVDAIYFLGANENQQAYRIETGSSRFEELPRLRTELLQYSKLEQLFLPDRDQFTVYTENEFNRHARMEHPLLDREDVDELQTFMNQIDNRLVIHGDALGVFILILLDDRFFDRALPKDKTDGLVLSIASPDDRILWSTAADDAAHLPRTDESGGTIQNTRFDTSSVKELLPFRLRILHSDKQSDPYHFPSALLLKMAGLSLLTMLFTLFVSLFCMKKIFKPFRIISRKLKSFMKSEHEMVLRSLPEDLIRKGLHSVSLRNKLILVLLVAVSIPAVSNGVLYYRFLNQEVERKMEISAETLGDFSAVGIRNRVRYMENFLNELSISEQVRTYATSSNPFLPPSTNVGINLTSLTGLSEVSYFVLLDEKGNAIYSSIYLNSRGIFSADPRYLLNQTHPYWISNYSNYKDVFNHISTAVVKRIEPASDRYVPIYLLLVPKESIFEIVQSGQINASYIITDSEAQTIYESRSSSDIKNAGQLRYSKGIPGTDWLMSIDYVFNEVIDQNRLYQERFLFVMAIVFFLCTAAAIVIANLLVKPIKQLKETMLAVGAGDLAKRVAYDEHNEIGDIIKSYNRMINQLDQTIRQNMSMMEDNAKNKIRENDLLSMKTRAELQMLQAQINPHFLYNTLEAINMRSMKSGNHEISIIVGALADLFRYSIAKGSDTVLLENEMNHAVNYITIQQIRFGNSFEAEYDIPDNLRAVPVLRFILQPIIENAIKHGLAGWESGGKIRISASSTDDRLLIKISDNGIGMDKQALDRLQAEMEQGWPEWRGEEGGIGLKNVYHRLKLFYKDRMSMTVSSELMKGTEIAIEIPTS